MSHIAIQEKLNGSPDWMEHVTDEEYGQGASSSNKGGENQ
jgi:hypothetical protein